MDQLLCPMPVAFSRAIGAPRHFPQQTGSFSPTDALGRISAQTAKQVIFLKVREAERETIYREYADRVGELVNTSIKRVEGLDLVVDPGKRISID